MKATYLGWSGFLLEGGDVRVAIDPHWSSWTQPGALPPWDLTPLDGIVLSHGHNDHAGDVPDLLRLHPRAWLAIGPGLRAWGEALGIGSRLRILPINLPADVHGVSVRLLPGEHVGEGLVAQGRTMLRYGLRRPVSALGLARYAFGGPGGGTHAVFVRMPDGSSALHAAEVLHRKTRTGAWARQVAGIKPDLFLLGVEPGEEKAAARHALAVNAVQVRTFSPHARTRDHFGFDGGVVWDLVERPLHATRAQPLVGASP